MMDVKVIGVDIAKRYFQVQGVNASGTVAIRRKISRDGFSRSPGRLAALSGWFGSWLWALIIGHVSRVSATMSD
jgi:hypothetical protein